MGNLFGITHSNRKPKNFWTKNCFNSSFPAALANYMFAHNISVNYIKVDKDLHPFVAELPVKDLYNMGSLQSLDQLYFAFESKYTPYQEYSYDTIDGIDLVIQDTARQFLRPLEVKLTVIPDKTTCKQTDESLWGSEIVIRSATTQYCDLGMTHALQEHLPEIREMFESPCSRIQDWKNKTEIRTKLPQLITLCDQFEKMYYKHQQPLIMQPIWKTNGQSPLIVEKGSLDIFVWSDFAFTRLFLSSDFPAINAEKPLSRLNRASARFIRYWYEVTRNRKVHFNDISREMTYDLQTDKEFAVQGYETNPYMQCKRLSHLAVDRDALYEIILDGGENELMPERRFDQSVLYHTMKNPRILK